eukprot:TRINITY_DN56821_c0_g1_i1.p1 TRINITY_DN56821_c0_g1~~TRINITY_DN56821_c0_g1_i1.p1  ORF type:complete len:338 (-),score=34.35 TRINITY_DN56821_c0_g1_i1:33-1046(-)
MACLRESDDLLVRAADNGRSVLSPTKAIVMYMCTSVSLTVVNKIAVHHIIAGTVLVAVQLVATCAVTVMLHVSGLSRLSGTSGDALRWIPVGLLFGVLIWTGMQSGKYASLSTLTVLRNASPLLLLLAEWLLFGQRPTCAMVLSLFVSLFGICLYAWGELQTSTEVRGIIYISVDICLVCIDRVMERYLLQLKPIALSTSATVFIQNMAGLLPVMFLLIGPFSFEWRELDLGPTAVVWGLVSLPFGAAIAYVSVFLARALTATSALVVANIDKVLVLGYGVVIMHDALNGKKLLGCLIALLGGAWHAWARSVENASLLASEENSEIHPVVRRPKTAP